MQRIYFIDIAKAICIILVVVWHYSNGNSPEWCMALNEILGAFRMPFFMFASGYIYIATKKDIGYGGFMIKKIRRLMIPYFTVSLMVITMKLIAQGFTNFGDPVTLMSYLQMFYLPAAGYFLWFIWALWVMFAIVPLLKTKSSRVFFFFVCLALHFVPVSFPEVFCFDRVKEMMVFFMLGIVVYEHEFLRGYVNKFNLRNVVITTLLFVVLQYADFAIGRGENTLIDAMLPYIGILFIIEVSKFICHCCKAVQTSWRMVVAASSYVIYLLHTTFVSFAKAVFAKLPFDSSLWYVFVPEMVAAVSLGVLIPILLYRIFKKYRLTRLLFGL